MRRLGFLAATLLWAAACSVQSNSIAGENDGQTIALDVSSGRPVAQVTINDSGPYPIIFDTGAGATILLASLERDLGLSVLGHTPIGSPLGGVAPTGNVVRLDSVSVGGVVRRNLQAISIENALLPLRGALGVIGPAAIRDRVVEIDVSSSEMWIGPAPRSAVTNWNRIGRGDKLDATITIGGFEIPAHIDSGSAGAITLPLSAASHLQLVEPLRESGGMRTIDATRVVSIGRLNADADISGTPVRLDVANFADVNTAIIGSQALAGFTVVIDYPHRRWALVGTSAGPIAAQPPLGDFGARVMPLASGAIQVFGIDDGSRAAQSGLQIGDEITAVDGQNVANINPPDLRGLLSSSSTRLTIQRNGGQLELSTP
ncbi:MAG: aspartyl protease family protein [Hyphomonadaceae bacterium]